ncbi:HD domain-containing phosphohydrolase [Sideroxydans sp. CL21]|uniref:HD-GYP domain-containing protein n=1 Tax=Sideroxydans sp. CL21 TaxID=2600596 RepID=UPI0012A9F91C|nr:HD domain-containing phosphohydrolase [Sideroxydans sp. CL21]VVC84116.1 Response regulator [Sideroxydans sp. CL21]
MNTSLLSRHAAWFSLDDFIFHINQANLRVRAEQLRTRLSVYPWLVLSQIILQFLFVILFWSQAPHQLLLSWLAILYALHAVELIRWFTHRDKLNTLQDCRDWHLHFTIFALAAGMLWGAATVVFFPADIAYQSLLICVMLGLVAGAVTMNSVHLPSLYGYFLGIMIPLILRVSFENDTIHWILTLMLSVYVAVVVLEGRSLNKTFVLSLQQRFENSSLLQQLTAQKAETEEARNQLERTNIVLHDNESRLEQMVHERTAQLRQRSDEIVAIKDTTILALTSLAGTRDNETGNHILRTQNYVRTLAIQLRDHPRFKYFLTDENIEMLFKIAALHDIGKVGIPDRILHKPGKLTPEEFEIMKTHTTLGGNAISGAENLTNVRNSTFLKAARQIAIGHHEKWDGSGYPFALREEHISIPARLMALADVYDAMSCRRVYKSAMVHDEVAEVIVEGKWKHFDPDVVDAFAAVIGEFKEIAARYRDQELNASGWKVAA